MRKTIYNGNRMLSLLLAVLMLFSMLPAMASAADPNYVFGSDEALVTNAAQFTTALQNAAITTIYFGANIELTTTVTIAKRLGGSLTINGTNPRTGETFSYTDPLRSTAAAVGLHMGANTNITAEVTFKDIKLNIRNYYGILGTANLTTQAGSACRVIFDGVEGTAPQFLDLFNAVLVIKDSNLTIETPSGVSNAYGAQELAECGTVVFKGNVNIEHKSSYWKYSVFWFNNYSWVDSVMLIEDNANVIINQYYTGTYSAFCRLQNGGTFTMGKNASFTFNSIDRFQVVYGSDQFDSVTIGEGSEFKLNLSGSGTEAYLWAKNVNVNEGASLEITTNTANSPLRVSNLNLVSPRKVLIYNGGTGSAILASYSTTLDASGIKSMRYFSSAANYASDVYSKCFLQESGSFSVKASSWGSSSSTLISTNYSGGSPYNTINSGSDISAYGAKAVEINGDYSKRPTVNSVAEGAYEITGTGVPGAKITVSSPTTGTLETVEVDSEGKWTAGSAVPFIRDETVTATQEEKSTVTTQGGEAIYYGVSEPVTTVVLGKDVTLVPGNNMEKTYTDDTLGVEVSNSQGADSFVVTRVDYVIFDDPDEDIDAKDGSAFDSAFADTSMNTGTITEFTASGGVYTAVFPDSIQYNCAVWARAAMIADGVETTAYGSVSYRNIYTPFHIYIRAVIDDSDPADELYGYTLIEGSYGIPYMGDGATVYTNGNFYGFEFDEVPLELDPYYTSHWSAEIGRQSTPYTLTMDSSFFDNDLCDGVDVSKYSLQCTKKPGMWWDSTVVYYRKDSTPETEVLFENTSGIPVSQGTISVPLTEENGTIVNDFYGLGGRYDPPSDEDTLPVGWFVAENFSAGYYTETKYISDFSSSKFNPAFTDVRNDRLYIIYKTGQFKVEEHFIDEVGNIITTLRTHTLDKDDPVNFIGTPKTVSGYVPVGYEVKYDNGSSTYITYNFGFDDFYPANVPTANQYTLFPDLEIGSTDLGEMGASGTVDITYIYAIDGNHSGIPDDEETSFKVHWRGYTLTGGIYTEIQQYLTIYSRIGYELTVTNTYPDAADNAHIINHQGRTWIFDQWTNPPSRTVTTDGSQEDVIFAYGISSDGSTLDNRQYVTEDYCLLGDKDNNLTGWGTSMGLDTVQTHILKGTTFNKTPGAKMIVNGKTYLYVGCRLEDEEGDAIDEMGEEITGDINSFTYAGYDEAPEPVSVTVPLERYRVVYLYREKAAPVAVTWEGVTYAGNAVMIGSIELNGYVGESVMADINGIDTGTAWKFAGSYKGTDGRSDDESLTFALSGSAQSGRFTYTEASTSVTVTFKYVGDDGNLNIQYTVDTLVNGRPITVNIFPLSGYEASGWILEDSQGIVMDSGDTIDDVPMSVDPGSGSQTLTITYRSTLTSLYIRCIDADGDEEIENQRIDDVSVGNLYAARALYVDGYALASDESLLKSIIIVSGVNEIVFYYERITGGTLILREAVYSGNDELLEDQGTIIEYRNLNAAPDSDVDIPSLEENYYTTVSTVVKQYNGVNTVTYYYDKQMIDVELQPVDESGVDLSASVTLAGEARKGEMYRAVTDITVQGYTLTDSIGKYVYADPEQTVITVPFTYSKDKLGDVTVKYYYHDADNEDVETLLKSTTLTVAVGSKLTASAEAFYGFELAAGEKTSKEIMVAESGNEITFLYTDIRSAVTVEYYIPDGTGGWIVSGDPEIYRFMDVGDCYITPGVIADHVLVGFTIDEDDPDNMTPVTLGATKINIGAVSVDETVYLYYKATGDAVDEYYSTITVTGKEGTTDLYSYTLRVPKAGGNISVSAFTYAGKIVVKTETGGVEQPAAPMTVSIDPANGNQAVIFTYLGNIQNITVYAYKYGTTEQIITPIVITNIENGSTYSYDSLSIPGYQLVDSDGVNALPYTETITSVSNSSNTIAFYYKVAEGDQTVIYKDSETLEEISRDTLTVGVNTQETIPIPIIANYTTVTTEAASVTWDGETPLSDIIYLYTRNKASVTLAAYNTVTGLPIENSGDAITSTLTGKRVLTSYDYSSDIAGLTALVQAVFPNYAPAPVGSTLAYVSTDSGSNVVRVWYTPPSSGTITVEVRADRATGDLIHSYIIPAASGETITLSGSQILSIPGHTLDSARSTLTATEGTEEKIIIVMTDNRCTVTVKTVAGGTTKTAAMYKVADGESLDIAVPYISGFVLRSYQIRDEAAEDGSNVSMITESNITDDVTVTFIYAPIEEVVDEHTVKITVTGAMDRNETELYKYVTPVAKNSGEYEVKPFTVNGYSLNDVKMDGVSVKDSSGYWDGSALKVNVADADIEVEFVYVSLNTDVTISLWDADNSTLIDSFKVSAVTGEPLSYYAPDASGGGLYYYLIGQVSDESNERATIGRIDSVERDGSSEIIFYYRQISNSVILVAKEDNTDGRIIMIVDVSTDGCISDTIQSVSVPDLNGDYYSYIGYDAGSAIHAVEEFGMLVDDEGYDLDDDTEGFVEPDYGELEPDSGDSFDGINYTINDFIPANGDNTVEFLYDSSEPLQIIEVYYEKQTMDIPIIARENDAGGRELTTLEYTGARMGEVAYVDAPDISDYNLSDRSIKGVLAVEGAEVEFYYTAEITMGSLAVKVTASSTGTALSDASVTVWKPDGTTVSLYTDRSGLIKLTDVEFGTYTITASFNGYNSGRAIAEISVESPDASVLIALGRTTQSGGSGGGSSAKYTVTYNANGGAGSYRVEGLTSGSTHTALTLKASGISHDDEYTFMGWDTKAGGTGRDYAPGDKLNVQSDITLYAQWERKAVTGTKADTDTDIGTDAHIAYLNGYSDGSIKPDSVITRAEAATILFRVLEDGKKAVEVSSRFTDVSSSAWYAQAVNCLASLGYLDGYPDGTFRPDGLITRAEFTAIIARVNGLTGSNVFTDVPSGHWAARYIDAVFAVGWITGYPDGTFRPENSITRAEAVKIINAMLGRKIDDTALANVKNPYNDISSDHWAYAEIIEASVVKS